MPGNKTSNRDVIGRVGINRNHVVATNNLITDVERLRAGVPDGVINNVGCGLSVDANANDIEMDSAVTVRWKGFEFPFAAEDPIDTSTKTINTNTVATSKADCCWVFADVATGLTDCQSSSLAEATNTTEIMALAMYTRATTTLPPSVTSVPIGVVSLVEGGSGAFTWGTDSITAEGEVYYSLRGAPVVVTAAASFAATGGATATFAYGAGKARLGTGTVVSYTGKTGVAFDAVRSTNIPTGNTGVWLLYVLADDSEIALQYGGAGYASLIAAQNAVRAHNANPLMPVVGVIYLQNHSVDVFVPATTNLNVSGITTTFTIVAAGTGYVFSGASDFTAAQMANLAGTVFTA
jgi:hypothetical protein